jgi:hypothetical protein
MSIQFSRQGMAALPASFARPRSSFVRRLLRAREDAVKQRVRTWLMGLDDERLLGFGLAPEDIALLRGFPRGAEHPKDIATSHSNYTHSRADEPLCR